MIRARKSTSSFLTAAFLLLPPSLATAQMVGFESEFATADFMEAQWGEKQLELSKKLLEIVKNNFDGKGEITSVPWAKYQEKNLQIMIYKDPRGRTWKVDPEAVNTTGLDGVEFVTPPLENQEDIERYSKIMQDLRNSKLVMGGLRSSNHVTVDVSHLMKDPNNISKLVDLILTIENHWTEIYRFYDPVRYGTIINRFSVPLALDQQDLLKELAALPEHKRSYNNVRSLFLKYDKKENDLHNADGKNPIRKWKYRAANYGKIFRLSPDAAGISAIEFRIGDLDFGTGIQEKVDFMRKLVNSDKLDKKFLSPFGDRALTWKQGTEFIQKAKLNTEFLKNLVSEHKLDLIQKKTAIALAVPAKSSDLVSMNQPVVREGKFITFGFEAEFVFGAQARKVVNGDKSAPLLDKFPYLDSDVSTESTGNIEVRSVGGERILGEVLAQMHEIRSNLKEDLRGFHMHMRIPKEIISQHDPELLKAWIANISDSVFAWRLQNRKHFFALRTTTLARQNMDSFDIGSRGPVRLIKMADGTWDFEIRGYMGSVENIGVLAQKVMTGLSQPHLISTNIAEQKLLGVAKYSLREGFEKYYKTFHQRDITKEESLVISRLSAEVQGKGLVPLYDFGRLFDYDPVTKRKINDATVLFFKEAATVVRNQLAGKYSNDQELGKQFRWRVKRWAQNIDLQSLLEKRILFSYADPQGNKVASPYLYDREAILQKSALDKTYATIDKNLNSADPILQRHAIVKLRGMKGPKVDQYIEKALNSKTADNRFEAFQMLETRVDVESLRFVETALNDSDLRIKDLAIRFLQGRSDTRSLSLIDQLIQSTDSMTTSTALYALKARKDVGSIDLIEKYFNDPDKRKILVYALGDRSDEKSLSLIEMGMNDSNAVIKQVAILALRGRKEPKALQLIEQALNDKDNAGFLDQIALALQKRSDAKSLELIQRIWAKQDLSHIMAATTATIGRTDKESLTLLETFMNHEKSTTRAMAIRSLRDRNEDKVLSLIEKTMGDEPRILAETLEVLKNRTDAKSIALLEKLLTHQDNAVREQALEYFVKNATDKKFYEVYQRELINPQNKGAEITMLQRGYIKRYGSLKAPPISTNLCSTLFR